MALHKLQRRVQGPAAADDIFFMAVGRPVNEVNRQSKRAGQTLEGAAVQNPTR